ncbi:hypothetical protein C6496_13800 [Candidatus Poribacteria bacterium]|nr:MAG: hypothetical protein C6496_13800 [Candidatus Poribacteria bacterium]
MNKQMYWGIAALIIVLIAAGGFMYWQWSTVQQMKEELAQDDKQPEEDNKGVAENNLPPAEPGKKWVPHGDHFHEVPIDAPDTWQGEPHEPVAKEMQAKPAYTGPLTYHAELLETNPVEALRLQAEERGHWSAEWIPTFDPGDQEAEAIARSLYTIHYYKSIGDTDNPIYKKAGEAFVPLLLAIEDHRSAKRRMDLLRLTWTHLSSEHAVTRVSPSNQALPLK